MLSDRLKFKTCQEPLARLDCDIVRMFIRWSCTNFEILVAIIKNKMAGTAGQSFNMESYGENISKLFFETIELFESKLGCVWMVLRPKKIMCVYCRMSKKSRVGRH